MIQVMYAVGAGAGFATLPKEFAGGAVIAEGVEAFGFEGGENLCVLVRTGDDLPGRTGVRQRRFLFRLNSVG